MFRNNQVNTQLHLIVSRTSLPFAKIHPLNAPFAVNYTKTRKQTPTLFFSSFNHETKLFAHKLFPSIPLCLTSEGWKMPVFKVFYIFPDAFIFIKKERKDGSRQINLQTAARESKTFYCVFNSALEGLINCYDGHMLVNGHVMPFMRCFSSISGTEKS